MRIDRHFGLNRFRLTQMTQINPAKLHELINRINLRNPRNLRQSAVQTSLATSNHYHHTL